MAVPSDGKLTTPTQSIIAGAAAGGVESLITYPTEFLKTRQQLRVAGSASSSSPLSILLTTIKTHGIGALYTGAGAFCITNASKSGIRFLTFDAIQNQLPRNSVNEKPTAMSNMIAGAAAGVAESVTVVTPGENLKTKIVDDRSGLRQYKSSGHALRTIIATEGVAGLYRGVLPVTIKQASNAFIRFASYGAILERISPVMDHAGSPMLAPPCAGAAAGVVTVYVTMPFDNVKTRMQALDGKAMYRGTWHCFCSILQQFGVSGFWRGTTPRLARLSASGAISFSIYTQVVELMQQDHHGARRRRIAI